MAYIEIVVFKTDPETGRDVVDRDLTLMENVPKEFASVISWLVNERITHQHGKRDYGEDDLARSRQGLTEESWFWTRGVENYAGRVRLWQRELGEDWFTNPLAIQAILKLAATMACIPEHLLRGGVIDSLPKPGLPSGALD